MPAVKNSFYISRDDVIEFKIENNKSKKIVGFYQTWLQETRGKQLKSKDDEKKANFLMGLLKKRLAKSEVSNQQTLRSLKDLNVIFLTMNSLVNCKLRIFLLIRVLVEQKAEFFKKR